jgi:hypothetical protein
MSSLTIPRIALGNGKFCYSGPSCRQHGTKHEVNALSKPKFTMPTPFELTQQSVEIQLAANIGKVHDYICKNSVHMKSLSELGDDALVPGLGARKCEVHGSFHVYNTNKALVVIPRSLGALHKFLRDEEKSGRLSQEETKELHARVKTHSELLEEELTNSTRVLLEGNAEKIKGTALWDQAQMIAASPHASSRLGNYSSAPVQAGDVIPPRISGDSLSDSQVLRYWQCGRKIRHDSEVRAEFNVKDNMKVYKCTHCDGYHVGHGDGSEPIESQVVSGRAHWSKNAEKADKFAIRQGLLEA